MPGGMLVKSRLGLKFVCKGARCILKFRLLLSTRIEK